MFKSFGKYKVLVWLGSHYNILVILEITSCDVFKEAVKSFIFFTLYILGAIEPAGSPPPPQMFCLS